jgi:hypothetical protein
MEDRGLLYKNFDAGRLRLQTAGLKPIFVCLGTGKPKKFRARQIIKTAIFHPQSSILYLLA